MDTTLLLHDNTGDPIEKRIRRAADRFEEKYGRRPDVCHVNPIHLNEGIVMSGIDVIGDAYIMPDRFLVGLKGTA